MDRKYNKLIVIGAVFETVAQLALPNTGEAGSRARGAACGVATATFLCENMNSLFCSHYNTDTVYIDIIKLLQQVLLLVI